MKRVELLAPAGSFEALKAAVSSGADAVYLGGTCFGARAFANNFDQAEMIQAVRYCHIRNVRVYVTVNTLIYEDELQQVIDYIRFLYEAQVDALIIQDLGLFEILRLHYPDFEIHCSTQMHIHNRDGVRFVKQQGAKRAVLARESSLELLKECAQEDIEIEAFVYGALCISYSGQCLMSSLNGNRSGNRGECAQPCRLKYQLKNCDTQEIMKTEGDYLLSPKDLFTVNQVPELIEAGISSFKIEGRMKRPEYVAEVVRIYRQAIDHYYEHTIYTIAEKEVDQLKTLFHRGFTTGHLMHQQGKDLMNPIRPNHTGIAIGRVEQVQKGKLTLALTHDLHQGDGIRILNKKEDMGMQVHRILKDGLLVNQAKANEVVTLETSLKITCQRDDEVVLTTDSQQCEAINKAITSVYRSIPIQGQLIAKIGQPIHFILDDGLHRIEVISDECASKAIKIPVSEEKIKEQLNKIKDTAYCYQTLRVDCDSDLFIGLKTLNELRREAIEQLDEARYRIKRQLNCFPKPSSYKPKNVPNLVIEVTTKQQVEAVIQSKKEAVIFSSRKAVQGDLVYEKGARVDETNQPLTTSHVLISQLGSLLNIKDKALCLADASFNVTNSYAAHFLVEAGMDGVVASLEAKDAQIAAIIQGYQQRYGTKVNLGKLVYGHRECMIMKHCVINTALDDGTFTYCQRCQRQQYALVNEKGKQFFLTRDDQCHSILLEQTPLQRITSLPQLSFECVRLTIETKEQSREILKTIDL